MGNCMDKKATIQRRSSARIECGPCQYFGEYIPATNWCVECSNGICESCLTSHSKVLRGHQLLPIYHSDQCKHYDISFFCPFHGEKLCIICRIQYHKQCRSVFVINEYLASCKISSLSVPCIVQKRVNSRSDEVKQEQLFKSASVQVNLNNEKNRQIQKELMRHSTEANSKNENNKSLQNKDDGQKQVMKVQVGFDFLTWEEKKE